MQGFFDPDIFVTSEDGTDFLAVIGTGLSLHEGHDAQETEKMLKQYMLSMHCATGLLVTLSQVQIYVDRFLSLTPDSIEIQGPYSLGSTFHDVIYNLEKPILARDRHLLGNLFAEQVQQWLERLSTGSQDDQLPVETQMAIRHYLLPALLQGTVRAAKPRFRRDVA